MLVVLQGGRECRQGPSPGKFEEFYSTKISVDIAVSDSPYPCKV